AEARTREIDRGREEARPGQAAMFAVRELQHAQQSRHADGTPAVDRLEESGRATVRSHEQLLGRLGGGGLAAVVSEPGAVGPAVEQEPGPTKSRGLRI